MSASSPEQREYWKRLILDQQKTKSSISEFCKEKEVKVHQFYYYRNLFFPEPKKSTGFVQLTVPEPVSVENPRMMIHLNQLSITLEGYQDVDFLVDLCFKLDQKL